MSLIITSEQPLPEHVQARIVTILNANGHGAWSNAPFVRMDDHTLVCRVTPERPGLQSFRAEFSLDMGATWLRDTVPDAWVLIDPPQAEDLRLYTLIPTVSGTMADWKEELRRIRAMGFNGVHLLPITALGRSESPYSARDLFEVDASYLSSTLNNSGHRTDGLSQLDDFVEAAKSLGIRLCFDLVLNHVAVDSTMATHAPDWIVPDQNEPDSLKRAGCWTARGWLTWTDLALINYEHPSESIRAEIREYMTEYALFWAKYADYTGGFVRFDNLHSSESEFVQMVTTELHTKYPALGIIAEYFTDERTLLSRTPLWGLNLILATPWTYKYVPQLRNHLIEIHRVSEHLRYFTPITSHDSGAPAQEFGTADSTAPRYAAAALMGTGATGMPQGVEWGESERIDFIGRKPRLLSPPEPRFARLIGQINKILADNAAFRCCGNCTFVDNGHQAIIAAFRQDASPRAIGFLVVCNFDIQKQQQITVDLTDFLLTKEAIKEAVEATQETIKKPVACCELLANESLLFPEPKLDLSLPPCGVKVFLFPASVEQEPYYIPG